MTAAPKLLYGHARLAGQHNTLLGGPARLTLYGTAAAPQLYADTPDSFSGVSLHPHPQHLVRFAREVLAFLGEDYGVTLPPWRPASDGAGRRPWFLARYDAGDESVPLEDRYRFGSRGVLIRYASMDSACRAAGKLNAAERQEAADSSPAPPDDGESGPCSWCGVPVYFTPAGYWSHAGPADHLGIRTDIGCEGDSPDGRHSRDDSGDLEEVPDHRNDLGDGCPRSGERTADGTCPLYCHEADVLVGFDAGDRELPDSTDLPRELWPEYHRANKEHR
jgi:hypothetical protein